MGELITFESAAGEIRAYKAEPARGRGRPVLLCHAWWGLNGVFTSLADRLADEGFAVLAPDLYNGRIASTIPEAEALIKTVEADGGKSALAKEQAALDHLIALRGGAVEKVGAIGFSMGAAYVSWLATLRREVAAVVLFYGGIWYDGGKMEDYPKYTQAAFQGHFAPQDEWEPEEALRATHALLRGAGRIADFYFYPGTKHWFFESNRPEYDKAAADLALERTLGFLETHL